MKFDVLSNEEIIFIYLIINDMTESINEIANTKGMEHYVNTPMGKFQIFMSLSDEDIEKLKEGLKYKLLNSINNKFEPIFSLIQESNPDLVKEVEEIIINNSTNIDEDEEEDL